jgi:hypothetical protein
LKLSAVVFHHFSVTAEQGKTQAALTELRQKYQSEVDEVRRQREDADATIADLRATLKYKEVG